MARGAAPALLQPSLLDRLIDSVPNSTVFDLEAEPEALARAGVEPSQIMAALAALGLERSRETLPSADPGSGAARDARLRWVYSAPGRTRGLADVKGLAVPAGSGRSVALESLCEIRARVVAGHAGRAAARSGSSTRRLRESVLRDLEWLLNAVSLESSVDLTRFPNVERSVLNFGMPSLAGRLRGSIEPVAVADRIRDCIETYEPRLSGVVVKPAAGVAEGSFVLEFRIEADLWGDPVQQHLSLRTRIDLSTGDLELVEGAG